MLPDTSERDNKGRFTAGNSISPGRNKREVELEYLDRLKSVCDPDKFDMITAKLVQLAKNGNIKAIELLFKYIIGLPVQRTELTGNEGGAINIMGLLASIAKIYGTSDSDNPTR